MRRDRIPVRPGSQPCRPCPRGREDAHESALNDGESYNTIPASSSYGPHRALSTPATGRVLLTGLHGEIRGRSSKGSLEYDDGLVVSLSSAVVVRHGVLRFRSFPLSLCERVLYEPYIVSTPLVIVFGLHFHIKIDFDIAMQVKNENEEVDDTQGREAVGAQHTVNRHLGVCCCLTKLGNRT